MPPPARAIHTPSYACTRERSPSTTLTLTITVSPGPKSGISLLAVSLVICSCSIVFNRFMAVLRRRRRARGAQAAGLFRVGGVLLERNRLVTRLSGLWFSGFGTGRPKENQ